MLLTLLPWHGMQEELELARVRYWAAEREIADRDSARAAISMVRVAHSAAGWVLPRALPLHVRRLPHRSLRAWYRTTTEQAFKGERQIEPPDL